MTNPSQSFVHLNVHTDHSIVNGLIKPKNLIKLTINNNQPAVGLTDFNFMSGVVSFFKAAYDSGVKPVIGIQIEVSFQSYIFKINVLVKNRTGYLNLNKLITHIYTRGHSGTPVANLSDIQEFKEGLLVLDGGYLGLVGKAVITEDFTGIEEYFGFFKEHFPNDFYIALSRCKRIKEDEVLHVSLKYAEQFQFPIVAVNDVLFAEAEDFQVHNIRLMINQKGTISNFNPEESSSSEQYFKSSEQMIELFSDLPDAIANTLVIAQKCNLSEIMNDAVLPKYPTNGKTEDEVLAEKSRKGLELRLEKNNITDPQQIQEYRDRLEFELKVISDMGFPGYFLIVMEFIQWSKDNDVPVGPGRGSGAGSLVAYALTITDIDPIPYKLLFERFLNPERVSMPDFDIDFCVSRRSDVINHVIDLYGEDSVCEIMTFGTLAAKAVLKDVARVLEYSYGVGETLSKAVPSKVEWVDEDGNRKLEPANLSLCLKYHEPFISLYKTSEEFKEIIDIAFKLEGVNRQVGKHAAGVVISPTLISDFSAVYANEEGKDRTTHYDKSDVEKAGLVKFDFLGLRNLTIIKETLRLVNQGHEEDDKLNIETINLADESVFQMLCEGSTHGVFQLESEGMKNLIKKMKPSCFEDIIALVALFRPGPLESGMVDNFIDRKHNREPIHYPSAEFEHLSLKPVLESTYGIIVYQEQVMQIAQVLAGYSLGQADLLRRAMGKKDVALMREQQSKFMEGAKNNGIDAELAGNIYELVDKFAGYGFNKSHSAAYALIAYQTLYLKKHHQLKFLTALLTVDHDAIEKMESHIKECRRLKVEVLPVDINQSLDIFTADGESIRFGLASIKGFTIERANLIVEERTKNGPYTDLIDFKLRNPDLKKQHFTALNGAGAFDNLKVQNYENSVREIYQYLLDKVGLNMLNRESTQGLFDIKVNDINSYLPAKPIAPWTKIHRLNVEKDSLGYFFQGHPFDLYRKDVEILEASCSIDEIKKEKSRLEDAAKNGVSGSDRRVRLRFCGIVTDLFIDKVQATGKRILRLVLSDGTDSMKFNYSEVNIDALYTELIDNPFVFAEIVYNIFTLKETGEEKVSGRIHQIKTIEKCRYEVLKEVELRIDLTQGKYLRLDAISDLIKNQNEDHQCDLKLSFVMHHGEVTRNENLRVAVSDAWLSDIEANLGEGSLKYTKY